MVSVRLLELPCVKLGTIGTAKTGLDTRKTNGKYLHIYSIVRSVTNCPVRVTPVPVPGVRVME